MNFTLLTSLLLAVPGAVQNGAPVIGQKAPELTFQSVIGGKPADWNLDALKGQVVVVDFSASWCGPCRIAFPHYNKLAQELKGKPIKFLCVTAEDAATAAKFRSELKMSMPLAVDLDGSTFERYWVAGIPNAIVIDAKGNLAARLHPMQIEAKDLLALATGKPVSFPSSSSQPAKRSWNPKASAGNTSGTWIKRVEAKGQRLSMEPGKGAIAFDGLSPSSILSFAFKQSVQEIEFSPTSLSNAIYSGRVEATDRNLETARQILATLVAEQMGVTIEREKRTQKCYVLTKTDKLKLQKPTESDMFKNISMLGLCNLKYAKMADLVLFLRDHIDRPVVDETGIDQPFSIKIAWDALKGHTELIKQFEAAGFKLEATERSVTWIVAKKVGSS